LNMMIILTRNERQVFLGNSNDTREYACSSSVILRSPLLAVQPCLPSKSRIMLCIAFPCLSKEFKLLGRHCNFLDVSFPKASQPVSATVLPNPSRRILRLYSICILTLLCAGPFCVLAIPFGPLTPSKMWDFVRRHAPFSSPVRVQCLDTKTGCSYIEHEVEMFDFGLMKSGY